MPLKTSHATAIVGADHPSSQVSKNVWNEDHALDGSGSVDVLANLPASGDFEGDRFTPSDGVFDYVWNGSVWVAQYRVVCSPPVSGSFSWVNQNSATLDGSRGGLVLYGADAGGTSCSLLVKSLAYSPPYRVEIGFNCTMRQDNAVGAGLCLRQSSDGKFVGFGLVNAAMEFQKWTNATSFSANYTTLGTSAGYNGPMNWFAFHDDGANRISEFSPNGFDWLPLHSIGRTDHLTANQCGFFVNRRRAISMHVFHFREVDLS